MHGMDTYHLIQYYHQYSIQLSVIILDNVCLQDDKNKPIQMSKTPGLVNGLNIRAILIV